LATADISLVLLKPGVQTLSVPSKLATYMASGRPIIAAVDSDSDTARLVRRANCGVAVPPAAPMELTGAVVALADDPVGRSTMGENARRYAVEYLSRAQAMLKYAVMLGSLKSG